MGNSSSPFDLDLVLDLEHYTTEAHLNFVADSQGPSNSRIYTSAAFLTGDHNSTSFYGGRPVSLGPLTPENDDDVATAAMADADIGLAPPVTPLDHPWGQAVIPLGESECIHPISLELSPIPSRQSLARTAPTHSRTHANDAYLSCVDQNSYMEPRQDHCDQRHPSAFWEHTLDFSLGTVLHDECHLAFQPWVHSPHEGYQPLPRVRHACDDENTPALTRDVSLAMSRGSSHDIRAPRVPQRFPVIIKGRLHRRQAPIRKRRSSNNEARSHILRPSSSGEAENANKAFICPFARYGCLLSFKHKNEWKRHINKQHMHLGLRTSDVRNRSTGKTSMCYTCVAFTRSTIKRLASRTRAALKSTPRIVTTGRMKRPHAVSFRFALRRRRAAAPSATRSFVVPTCGTNVWSTSGSTWMRGNATDSLLSTPAIGETMHRCICGSSSTTRLYTTDMAGNSRIDR